MIQNYFVSLQIQKHFIMMKKTLLCLLIASTMLAGCHREVKEFKTVHHEGQHCLLVTCDEEFLPGGDSLAVENCYSLEWPAKGVLTPEAEMELLLRTFGDSTTTTFDQAASRWLEQTWLYEDDMSLFHIHPLDSIGDREQYTYAKKESTISRDSNLATMLLTTETFAAYAAHGLYSVEYFVMDLDTKKIVHLNDLVDTAQLGEVIIRAIEDLEVNKDTRECMFDEYRIAGRVAVPQDFFIDSTRSVIYLVFQQYDITPYACGIQTVALPIFWLSKHIPLTPYCKEIFGEGCSID